MKRFKNILAFLDTSTDYQSVLRQALELARNNEASLTLLAVVEPFPDKIGISFLQSDVDIQHQVEADLKEWLKEMVEKSSKSGVEIHHDVGNGQPFSVIIGRVLRGKHDIVLLAPENSSEIAGLFYGSTALHLMRKCPSPVWVVKPGENDKPEKIAAAIDLDSDDPIRMELCGRIIQMAASLARNRGGELHILHAWQALAESVLTRWGRTHENEIHKYLENFREEREKELQSFLNRMDLHDLNWTLHMDKGKARMIIPRLVRKLNCTTVVMGTVSRVGIAGLLIGNTAENVLAAVNGSILTVKPQGFLSPVTAS